ncbi:unnamed protein product, partial [Adineta steineri]
VVLDVAIGGVANVDDPNVAVEDVLNPDRVDVSAGTVSDGVPYRNDPDDAVLDISIGGVANVDDPDVTVEDVLDPDTVDVSAGIVSDGVPYLNDPDEAALDVAAGGDRATSSIVIAPVSFECIRVVMISYSNENDYKMHDELYTGNFIRWYFFPVVTCGCMISSSA